MPDLIAVVLENAAFGYVWLDDAEKESAAIHGPVPANLIGGGFKKWVHGKEMEQLQAGFKP